MTYLFCFIGFISANYKNGGAGDKGGDVIEYLRNSKNTEEVDTDMENIIERAMEQNFVPVVDDEGIFIGIIKRREIIEYCFKWIFV